MTPPDNTLAHLLASIFALSGVACLGIALGVIGHRLVELESKAMDRAQQDVMTLFSSTSMDDSMHKTEEELLPEDEIMDDIEEIHQNTQLQQRQRQHTGTKLSERLWDWTLGRLFSPTPMVVSSSIPHGNTSNSARRRRKELHQSKGPFQPSLKNINKQFLVFLGLIVVFSYFIGDDSGWNFSQTLYFAITTSCTIGYGDFSPQTQMGRLLVVGFIPFAVGAMGFFLHGIAETILDAKQRRHMVGLFAGGGGGGVSSSSRQQQRELTVMDLEAMDADGDGNVDWSEFLEFMLVAMKKVDEDLMWELRYQFDSLDVDDTGVLSKENLISMARQRLQQTSHKLQLLKYKQHLLATGGSGTVHQ